MNFIDELRNYGIEQKAKREKDKLEWEEKRRNIKISNFNLVGLPDLFKVFKLNALDAANNNKNFVHGTSFQYFDEDLKPIIKEFFEKEGFKIEYQEQIKGSNWTTSGEKIELVCRISW